MASNTEPKTILLKGRPYYREGVANAAITPGHLVQQMTTGNFRVHASAAGVRPSPLFAREEEYVGGSIGVAYAASDTLPYMVCQPGDQVYALVPAAAAAIVIGDLLESNGDGTLRKAGDILTDNSGGTANTTLEAIGATYDQAEVRNNFADLALRVNAIYPAVTAVARAIEAVDNSGGGAVARIKVEIL